MKVAFRDLPYPADALEPHYVKKMVDLHYGKHHRTYFDNMVKAIKGTKYEEMELEDIVRAAAKDKSSGTLFNNAAQVWNHDMFWRSMKPSGGGQPSGELKQRIEQDFGSFDEFRKKFSERAAAVFGSGWAWLVLENGKLNIMTTANAEDPLTTNATTLFALDVWEHAYYIEYENRRPEYIQKFFEHLVNWDFAAEQLRGASVGQGESTRRAAGAR